MKPPCWHNILARGSSPNGNTTCSTVKPPSRCATSAWCRPFIRGPTTPSCHAHDLVSAHRLCFCVAHHVVRHGLGQFAMSAVENAGIGGHASVVHRHDV